MVAKKEKITIKSPPISELEKQSSCLKRSCITGCGCIVVFLLGLLLIVFSLVQTRSKQISTIPEHIQQSVAIYAADDVNNAQYTASEDQNRFLESVAFIPKFILSPFVVLIDDQVDPDNTAWSQMKEFIQDPVLDARTKYQFTWNNLPASPQFIKNYYTTKLKQKGFEVIEESDEMLRFSSDSIDGTIIIISADKKDTTQSIFLEFFVDSNI